LIKTGTRHGLLDKDIGALEALLGPENVEAGTKGNCVWVRPGSSAEVSALFRFSATYRLPINVKAGKGKKPVASSALVLSLERFDKVKRVEPRSMLMEAGAGVTGSTIEDEAASFGLVPIQRLAPVDSIGAFLSRTPVIPSAYRGGESEFCCALNAVLADGREVRTRITPRSATGPDIKHLLLGTRGMIGVILHAVIRLEPVGLGRADLLWSFEDKESALGTAAKLQGDGILWPGAYRLTQESKETVLAIRLKGDKAVVSVIASRIAETARANKGKEVRPGKEKTLERYFDAPRLKYEGFFALARRIKRQLDPSNLLNAGESS